MIGMCVIFCIIINHRMTSIARSKLREFYGLDNPIDRKDFDAKNYYEELLSKYSISELIQKQNQWKSELDHLELESKILIQQHHSKYLKAARLMQKMVQLPNTAKVQKERLLELYKNATNKTEHDINLKMKELLQLYEREEEFEDIGPILNTPKRMESALSRHNYAEAIQEYVQFFDWIRQVSDPTPFMSVKEECKALLSKTTDNIFKEFKSMHSKPLKHDISDIKTLQALNVHNGKLCDAFLEKLYQKCTDFLKYHRDLISMIEALMNYFIPNVYYPYYKAFLELFCSSPSVDRINLLQCMTRIDNQLLHSIISHPDLENNQEIIVPLMDKLNEYQKNVVESEKTFPFYHTGIQALIDNLHARFSFNSVASRLCMDIISRINSITKNSDDISWTELIQSIKDLGISYQSDMEKIARLDALIQNNSNSYQPDWSRIIHIFQKLLNSNNSNTRSLFFIPRFFIFVLDCDNDSKERFLILGNRILIEFSKRYCASIVYRNNVSSVVSDAKSLFECYNIIYSKEFLLSCDPISKYLRYDDMELPKPKDKNDSIQARLEELLLEDQDHEIVSINYGTFIFDILDQIIRKSHDLTEDNIEELLNLSKK